MNSLLLASVLMTTYSAAPAPPPPVKPIGPVPTMAVAKVEGDRLTLTRTHGIPGFVNKSRTVQVGNLTTTEVRTVPVLQLIPVVTTHDLKVVKGFDTANKPIDANKLAERLKTATVVVVSADGQPIDEMFRKVLKDDVILLILPQDQPAPEIQPVVKPVPAVPK